MTITIDVTANVLRVAEVLTNLGTTQALLIQILQTQRELMVTYAQIATAFESLKGTLTTEIEQINTKINDALTQSGTAEEREALLQDIVATNERIAGIIADTELPPEEPEV